VPIRWLPGRAGTGRAVPLAIYRRRRPRAPSTTTSGPEWRGGRGRGVAGLAWTAGPGWQAKVGSDATEACPTRPLDNPDPGFPYSFPFLSLSLRRPVPSPRGLVSPIPSSTSSVVASQESRSRHVLTGAAPHPVRRHESRVVSSSSPSPIVLPCPILSVAGSLNLERGREGRGTRRSLRRPPGRVVRSPIRPRSWVFRGSPLLLCLVVAAVLGVLALSVPTPEIADCWMRRPQ